MALDAYSMDDLFDTDFTMTKAERLDFGESPDDPCDGIDRC